MAQLELKELPAGTPEEDVVKPVKLAKELSEATGKEVRPQIVYGFIRNGGLQAYTKDGEGRYILRSEFKAWQEAKATKKVEREAAKAEKATKKAEKAEVAAKAPSQGDEDYKG